MKEIIFEAKDGADLVSIIKANETEFKSWKDATGREVKQHFIKFGDIKVLVNYLMLGGRYEAHITFMHPFVPITLQKSGAEKIANKFNLANSSGNAYYPFELYEKKLVKGWLSSHYEKGLDSVARFNPNAIELAFNYPRIRELAKDIFDLYLQAQQ